MKALISIPTDRNNHFVRACFMQAKAGIQNLDLESVLGKDDFVSRAIVDRAAVAPATTTTAGNASELAQTAFLSFLGSIAPYGAAARLVAGALSVRLAPSNVAKIPVRSTNPTAPQWVAEDGAIPINVADFDFVDVGPPRKLASIVAWSHELNRRSDAGAIFERLLREDVAAGLDLAMFSTAAGSSSAYAGLLHGVTPATAYSGGDHAAIEQDLLTLGTTVAANGGSGQVLYVMAPERAVRLRIKAPLIAAQLDIATSASIPTARVVAVDPMAIISGIDSAPDIDFGDQATLHMSDTALPIVTGGVTADPVRSVWQTASKALRVLYDVAWAKRRATAVAYLDDATW